MPKQNRSLFFSLAKQYGTPFYLYDQAILHETYHALRTLFPPQCDIFYSLKANPNIAICSAVQRLGAGAEVCSLLELECAKKSGFAAENIIFLGPAKTETELLACIQMDIAAIVCESKREFQRIALLAERCQKQVNVALRINPHFVSKTAALKMGGQSSQFGMDEEIILNEQDFFFAQSYIRVIGIQVYNGTRILDAETIVDNTENIFHLFKKFNQCSPRAFTFLDIGGGLGVPYFKQETALDLIKLKQFIQPVFSAFSAEFPAVRLILETGRFLLAPAGVMVSRIVDKKNSKGKIYLITDGGTNCHMAAVGVGVLVKDNFPISLVSQNPQLQHNEVVQIAGPLCTPGDLLAKNISLPLAEIGDLVVVHYSGAYGLTASPILFLSHGAPVELFLIDNQVDMIRARQTTEDFFKQQFCIGQK